MSFDQCNMIGSQACLRLHQKYLQGFFTCKLTILNVSSEKARKKEEAGDLNIYFYLFLFRRWDVASFLGDTIATALSSNLPLLLHTIYTT